MANSPVSYADKFRSLQPEKLAEIIVDELNHHPDAVKAARLELTARMLPKEELDRVYDLAEAKNIKRETKGYSIGLEKRRKLSKTTKISNEPLWLRTRVLMVIGAFLIFNLCYVVYKVTAPSLQTSTFELSGIPVPYLITSAGILLIILGAGIKGSKLAWWGALVLFFFNVLGAINNAYMTYQYYPIYNDNSNGLSALIAQFSDDPLTAGVKVFVSIFLFYLLVRKDTRIACGVSKKPGHNLDEIDHLEPN